MPARTCLPYLTRRLLLAATAATLVAVPALAQDTLKLGLVAAMSGQSAKSGEAIVRGLSIAIDEINAKGGVLGKKVELVVRDDESNPAKGVVAARELVQREGRRPVRRPRYAGFNGDCAFRQSEQSTIYGRVGGRDADHPEWRRRRTTCFAFQRSTSSSTKRSSITP